MRFRSTCLFFLCLFFLEGYGNIPLESHEHGITAFSARVTPGVKPVDLGRQPDIDMLMPYALFNGNEDDNDDDTVPARKKCRACRLTELNAVFLSGDLPNSSNNYLQSYLRFGCPPPDRCILLRVLKV